MRSNRLLFTVLYLLGLALYISMFLTFVPVENRTNVKWLNFVIGLFIYMGLWGKYSLLYPLLGKFSDNIPTLTLYWVSFGWYVVATILAMVVFWALDVGFDKQAILQGCLLFAFIASIGVGLGASNFMKYETERIHQEIGGVRDLQQRVAMLKIILSELPPSYAFVETSFDCIVEAVAYLSECNNPKARDSERQIVEFLDKLQAQCSTGASADECLSTIKNLETSIAMRKSITNV